jgi:hypothetical protein
MLDDTTLIVIITSVLSLSTRVVNMLIKYRRLIHVVFTALEQVSSGQYVCDTKRVVRMLIQDAGKETQELASALAVKAEAEIGKEGTATKNVKNQTRAQRFLGFMREVRRWLPLIGAF